MGLNSLLKRVRSIQKEIKISFFGLNGSGKTSIIYSMKDQSLDSIIPTNSFENHIFEKDGFKFHLMDISGSKNSRSSWKLFLDSLDIIVWVIDFLDFEKFEENKIELENLLLFDKNGNSSVLILANKYTKTSDKDIRILDEILSSEKLISRKYSIIGVNSHTKFGIDETIKWIINEFLQKSSNE